VFQAFYRRDEILRMNPRTRNFLNCQPERPEFISMALGYNFEYRA